MVVLPPYNCLPIISVPVSPCFDPKSSHSLAVDGSAACSGRGECRAVITTLSFCPSFILFSSSVWCSHPIAPAFHPASSHLQLQRWVLADPSLVLVLPSMLSEDLVNVDLMAPFFFLSIGISDYIRGHCFYHCFCCCFALFHLKTRSKNK